MTFNKPPEWGKRFDFPENVQIEYNGYQGSVTSEIVVKMAERYEDAVVNQIAMEAKLAGVADCTVLNKEAILDAISKQTPKKPKDIAKSELYGRCAVCGQVVHVGNRYCDQCGQALDWGGIPMKTYEATEQAYKNGYEKGKQDAVKWISVKERLPKNIGLYLVIEKHWISGAPCRRIAKWNTVDWFTADRKSKEITPRVTHWMPLPEPPKGE